MAPSLRSPYVKVAGMFHFGRMLDKARARQRGELAPEYHHLLGGGFDGRVCRYLRVDYAEVARWAAESDDDEAIAERCFAAGRRPTAEEILILNSFLAKRGWRDDESAAFVDDAARSYGHDTDGSFLTDFDTIEHDEGRRIDAWREAWNSAAPHAGPPAAVEMRAGIYRCYSEPIEPTPTETEARLEPISDLRAVIFDIYGTLIISASGDISLAKEAARSGGMREALGAIGLSDLPPELDLASLFYQAVEHARDVRQSAGVEYPEVDIREVWQVFLNRLISEGLPAIRPDPITLEKLAIEYELRVNPVWPMPHLAETLALLKGGGLTLGIVSNAQFYTRYMFPAFLGQPLAQLGFAPDCCVYSYEEREGKPSTALYQKLVKRLAARGIAPEQALYVGNDLRNDIWPAAQVGLRTALFAGDARSLRWRKEDERLKAVQPDLVLTDLYQLKQVLPAKA